MDRLQRRVGRGCCCSASLFFRGNRMALFVLLGAAVAVVGHQFGIRTVEPFRAYHVALHAREPSWRWSASGSARR